MLEGRIRRNVEFRFYSSGLPRRDAIIIRREFGARAKPMSSAAAKKRRPKYLSLTAFLFEIRFPAAAWVSGFHRISGFLLFLPFTAWLLYLLDVSLASEQGFAHVRDVYLKMPIVRLGLLAFIWAFLHHLFAGLRFLLIDIDIGVDLPQARYSSYAVFAASILLTLFIGWRLWW